MKRALALAGALLSLAGARAFADRVQVGAEAPAFALESSTGKPFKLADWRGHVVVLAFFPKAFTGG